MRVKCSGEEMKERKEEVRWGNENNKNLDRDETVICEERKRRFAWQVDILEEMCMKFSGVESRSSEQQEDGVEWETALCRACSSEKNRVNFGNFPRELCNTLHWFVVLCFCRPFLCSSQEELLTQSGRTEQHLALNRQRLYVLCNWRARCVVLPSNGDVHDPVRTCQ